MSVMCSRPSMPPRSTNAPKSAMFLTVPLIDVAFVDLGHQLVASGLGALFSMSLRRLMTMLRRSCVDLEDLRRDLAADVLADVARAADVDLEAGRKTGTPMSTSRPPLILRMTLPFDDVAFGLGLDDALPAADAVGLALGELDEPPSPSMPSRSTSISSPTLRRPESSNSLLVDQAFALEADVDDDVVAGVADDLARWWRR
jgi:hypothetical protein